MDDIIEGILNKNKRIIAQSISKIDDEDPLSQEYIKKNISKNRKSNYNRIYGPCWCRQEYPYWKIDFLF